MINSVVFLVVAALVPPGVLLAFVYYQDKIEKESISFLVKLFFAGLVSMIPILFLELAAEQIAGIFSWKPITYLFLSYFLIPGFIEEGVKFRTLKRISWNSPEFNYTFDGVVYAVFTSLGFAAIENILYVLQSEDGFSVAVARAVFSIPGHFVFGAVMGMLYGKAKKMESSGAYDLSNSYLEKSWKIAAILHGTYDFLLMISMPIFLIYFIFLIIIVFRKIRKAEKEDGPILSYHSVI